MLYYGEVMKFFWMLAVSLVSPLVAPAASSAAGANESVMTESVSQSPVQYAVITGDEKAAIYQEFRKRLQEEEKMMEADEKAKRKGLVRHQSERRREWRETERRARRAFFQSHTSGPQRRHYVQDFVRRRKEFDQQEKNEWIELNRKQREIRKQLRLSQQERTRKVNEALSKNQRPEIY